MLTQQPTVEEIVAVSTRNSKLSPYVVGASVGGGLGLLLIGYMFYKYYEADREAKARELRKAEYYRQQAILVALARAETAKFIQEEKDRMVAVRLEREERRAQKHLQPSSGRSGGAHAVTPTRGAHATSTALTNRLQQAPSDSSTSSVLVSSLHSSDMSYLSNQSTDSVADDDVQNAESWESESVMEGGSEYYSSDLSDVVDEMMRDDEESEVDGEL